MRPLSACLTAACPQPYHSMSNPESAHTPTALLGAVDPASPALAASEEEECVSDHPPSPSSSASSDDRRAFNVRQALPTADDPLSDSDYEPDEEARAAAAYLAGVRVEAAGVRRKVAVAVPPGRGGQAPPPAPPASVSAAAAVSTSDPWLLPFLEQFAGLRAAVAAARAEGSGHGGGSTATLDLLSPPPPGLATTRPHPAVVEALERVAAASGAPPPAAAPGWRGETASAASLSPPPPLPGHTAAWAFTLAAGLERPLPPSACAALRSLGRAAGAAAREGGGGEEASSSRSAAAIVAAVAGAFFAQDEALAAVAREGWP